MAQHSQNSHDLEKNIYTPDTPPQTTDPILTVTSLVQDIRSSAIKVDLLALNTSIEAINEEQSAKRVVSIMNEISQHSQQIQEAIGKIEATYIELCKNTKRLTC
jgi:hypothetical protein